MELRHKFELNLLLSQTNMVCSNFYYHQKRTKLADKYQVIKELIKAFIKNIKVVTATDELPMNSIIKELLSTINRFKIDKILMLKKPH